METASLLAGSSADSMVFFRVADTGVLAMQWGSALALTLGDEMAEPTLASLAMTGNGGYYYIVGYGGKIDLPTIDMITTEKTIVGNLVGTYAELVELMALADRGLVNLHTKEYKLSQANDALHDLHNGRIHGRAVLIP